jgi:predicted nucleic acid-binding protein
MKLHLDTTVLIDWYRGHAAIASLRDDIVAGLHEVSYDPVVEAEYFAAPRIDRVHHLLFSTLAAGATRHELTSDASRLAARWLAPMDERMRRAHFADALIAAVAEVNGAALVTADRGIRTVLNIQHVLTY